MKSHLVVVFVIILVVVCSVGCMLILGFEGL